MDTHYSNSNPENIESPFIWFRTGIQVPQVGSGAMGNNDDLKSKSRFHSYPLFIIVHRYASNRQDINRYTVIMVTVDKENLQADTSNTAEESTTEEKQATAPSLAETEPDEQGAAATDNADSDAPQQAKIPDEEKTGDGTKRKIVESGPPSSLALRPVKRARTAYFIFADDRRAALQAKVS